MESQESVKEENERLRKEVEEYRQRKRALEDAIRARKEAYEESFHSSIPPGAREDEAHRWIEAKYLKQWITGERIKVETKESNKSGSSSSSSSSAAV